MSKLSENLGKRFIYTSEIAPPKGTDLTKFKEELKALKKIYPKLCGINVVDMPGGILLMSSIGASIMVKQAGMDPIYQVTCRDRNVFGLQADLLTASAFGIENILALTGDHPSCRSSDHPKAKPVYDLDSTSLIECMKRMNKGVDMAGNKLYGKTNFFIGAALAQTPKPIEPEIYKTKRKLDIGAQFFQTQAVFDTKQMWDFFDKYEKTFNEDIRKKVLVGLVSLYDYEILKFIKTIPNVIIPEKIEKRIKNAKDAFIEGTDITIEYIDECKEQEVGGVHVMSAGNTDTLIRVFENVK